MEVVLRFAIFAIGFAVGMFGYKVLTETHRITGYQQAVTDIMRYGFYIGADGKKHSVENIRIWSD